MSEQVARSRWMRVVGSAFLLALTLAAGFWLGGRHRDGARPVITAAHRVRYTCSMHPQVVQDQPGNCPICGMTLTPKREPADQAEPSDRTIAIDPSTVQNMGLRTAPVARGPLRRVIRTVAIVDYDETTLADVTTKFRGWVTKLWANATGQVVHRGDPLFEYYAPELYTVQAEFLATIGVAPVDADDPGGLRSNAVNRLRFLDISDDQISAIEKERQVRKTLRFDAPRDGIVVEKPVVEGQMVEAGLRLYRIADLGRVWVRAQVFEQDLPFIRVGQEARVTLDYLPDRIFRGRVSLIYPTVDEKTRTVQVRMEFYNPGYFLKPGMYATAELRSELAADALLVPDTAVLRSGTRNTVFVAREGGHFEPRSVTLGARDDENRYQVLAGLAAGERVVTSGQFLLDSESQLRSSIEKMEPLAMTPTSNAPAAVTAPAATEAAIEAFVCPMPEHAAIAYKQPGPCPLCGMAMVPVTAAQLSKLQPQPPALHVPPASAQSPKEPEAVIYTCPMHPEVRMGQPGECPICGMHLVPANPSGSNRHKTQ